MEIQKKILSQSILKWIGIDTFICDRTPIDFIAYTLAEVKGDTDDTGLYAQDYIDSCFDTVNTYFDALILIQPGIPLIFEENKASLSQLYIEHLNFLMLGLLKSNSIKIDVYILDRGITNIDKRVNFVNSCVQGIFN